MYNSRVSRPVTDSFRFAVAPTGLEGEPGHDTGTAGHPLGSTLLGQADHDHRRGVGLVTFRT